MKMKKRLTPNIKVPKRIILNWKRYGKAISLCCI
jgi:hypothetical protein